MTRHSSYSAPRSERPSGSYGGQRGRGSKRNTYNKRSWKDNKTLFTLVCFILPFIAINLIILFLAVSTPKIDYTISDTQDYKTVDLSIKIRSLLPLKEMTVTLETKPVELVKEKGVYKTTLEDNGTLEIQVTGWNGMTKSAYEHIATLDDAPPSIDEDDYVMEDGQATEALPIPIRTAPAPRRPPKPKKLPKRQRQLKKQKRPPKQQRQLRKPRRPPRRQKQLRKPHRQPRPQALPMPQKRLRRQSLPSPLPLLPHLPPPLLPPRWYRVPVRAVPRHRLPHRLPRQCPVVTPMRSPLCPLPDIKTL